MGEKIVFIIVIIVGLGIGLYLYNSGALVNGWNGFDSVLHASPGGGLFGSGSSTVATGSGSGSSFWSFLGAGGGTFTPVVMSPQAVQTRPGTISSASSSGNSATVINPADVPAGYTAAQLSPYFHRVRFSGISAGTSYSYGTITLRYASYNASTGTIDISGWQIGSKNSGEYIPQAIALYDPSGLAPASDIIIRNGDVVYLYSSSAPFNLRLNTCIGYVAHVATFKPALPANCPSVDRSAIDNFTGQCQNYILSIGACRQPNMSSAQIPRNDYACIDYLENNFTYKSCYAAHAGDANFLSNQVWVWTGANVVDRYHDTVKLLDKNGLLVDIYTY